MQRWGHGAASLTITPECEEVVIFGGQHKYFGSVIAETAVLRFGKIVKSMSALSLIVHGFIILLCLGGKCNLMSIPMQYHPVLHGEESQ